VVSTKISRQPNTFPVKYRVFVPERGRSASDLSVDEARAYFSITDLDAFPLNDEPSASWITLGPGMHKVFLKIRGRSRYRARIGAHSGGAAGVFWVEVVEKRPNGVLIRNLHDAGRNKFPQVTAVVEPDFVRPLLRGRDVERWKAFSRHSVLIPYEVENDGKAVSGAVMRQRYPKTFEYFKTFKSRLTDRPHYRHHFAPSSQPYWSMYNVGNYTFARHRVVWREQSAEFKCCVVPEAAGQPFVADAKLIVVQCASGDEAHFLAACLNSSPARFLIQSYAIEVQISTHVFFHVALPSYEGTKLQSSLAERSRFCHSAAANGDATRLSDVEDEIDRLTAKLWGLSESELVAIQKSLAESHRSDQAAQAEDQD
jgi:hypothetical protein